MAQTRSRPGLPVAAPPCLGQTHKARPRHLREAWPACFQLQRAASTIRLIFLITVKPSAITVSWGNASVLRGQEGACAAGAVAAKGSWAWGGGPSGSQGASPPRGRVWYLLWQQLLEVGRASDLRLSSTVHTQLRTTLTKCHPPWERERWSASLHHGRGGSRCEHQLLEI